MPRRRRLSATLRPFPPYFSSTARAKLRVSFMELRRTFMTKSKSRSTHSWNRQQCLVEVDLLTHPHAADETSAAIRPEALRADMRFLADGLPEGRGAGTRGLEIAARFIASEFEA